jgi:hypothetical protein
MIPQIHTVFPDALLSLLHVSEDLRIYIGNYYKAPNDPKNGASVAYLNKLQARVKTMKGLATPLGIVT